MRETKLGEFEEVILLLVGILGEDAYAFKIAEEFESQTERAVAIGAVHSTLSRLGEKGFLTSEMGGATAERGGRRKSATSSSPARPSACSRARTSTWASSMG